MDFRNVFLFVVVFNGFFCTSSAEEKYVCNITYDDKVMEKMIWTQVKVEGIMKEFNIVESRMATMLDNFKQTLQEQDEKYGVLKKELADLKDRTVVPMVAFFAYNLQDASADAARLKFVSEKYDIGSGYDPLAGIYTTPVAGVYQFTVQLFIVNGQWCSFHIRSEDKVIQKTVFLDDAGTDYGSQTAVATVALDASKKVWIQTEKSSDGNDFVLYNQHKAWNSFSGVLIKTLN